MGGDVGRGLRPDRQAVGGDPRRHRREEDVGERVAAEEPGAVAAVRARAIAQSASMRARSARDRRVRHEADVGPAQVHRAGVAQGGEARVHLRREAARERRAPAGSAGQRPRSGWRSASVSAIASESQSRRSRRPPRRAAPARCAPRRSRRAARANVGRVEPARVAHRHRQPEAREHQPAAQRPARIAAVADRQDVGHRVPPGSRLPRRRRGGQAAAVDGTRRKKS